MLEDLIESLVDLVEGAEPATQAAGHRPRLGQEPLGLEQLEDRLLMAADAEAAAEPLAPPPQEPAPAEAVAELVPALVVEISTSPAPKPGPASAESLDGAPEIAAELEHELANHLHDGEGQIGPGDGRVANRADSEPAEVISERSGESSHEATLEEHEGEEQPQGESEKALEELELSTAEERSRVDVLGAAGELASNGPSEDPTQAASETAAGMLSTAGAPGSVVIDLGTGNLETELSVDAAIDGNRDSESEPNAKNADRLAGEGPDASDPAQIAAEAQRRVDAGDSEAAGDSEGDSPKSGDPSQPSPLGENGSAPIGAAGDHVATDEARAHDACFFTARQAKSIEEAIAEAVVPDAASPKP